MIASSAYGDGGYGYYGGYGYAPASYGYVAAYDAPGYSGCLPAYDYGTPFYGPRPCLGYGGYRGYYGGYRGYAGYRGYRGYAGGYYGMRRAYADHYYGPRYR